MKKKKKIEIKEAMRDFITFDDTTIDMEINSIDLAQLKKCQT